MRTTIDKLTMLAVAAAAVSLVSVGAASAHGSVHGPGSSHNPIIFHPVHGPGSSHNPIVCHPRQPYCGGYPGGLPPRPRPST